MNTTLRSQELSCPSCVAKIEKSLTALDGVTEARVHFTTGRIVVEHDPDLTDRTELVAAVRRAGYESRVVQR